jgi:hypothetical protein
MTVDESSEMDMHSRWSVSHCIVLLGIGLFGTQGGSENRIKWILDEVAYYIRAGRRRPKLSVCRLNLEGINTAKKMWANDGGKTTNDVPSWNDLQDFLAGQSLKGIPICPDGGSYSINRVGERPTCSIGGSRHAVTIFVPEEGASSKKAK